MKTHLSLFTGIGGLDIAAEMAGFETVGQCEWADYPTKVLEKHWPDVPRWRDIRTLTKESFYERTGLRTVDAISGGFPCQPFSLAGSRKGMLDERYLWPEMLRVCDELRPTWIIGENVAGLRSMVKPDCETRMESRSLNRLPGHDIYEAVYTRHEELLLPDIIRSLEEIGYEVQVFAFPAAGVGAPHQRDRTCIVANAIGGGCWAGRECGGMDGIRASGQDNAMQAAEPSGDVSNPNGIACGSRRAEPTGQQWQAGTANGGDDVADADEMHAQRRTEISYNRRKAVQWELERGRISVSNSKHQRLQVAGLKPRIKTVPTEFGTQHGDWWSIEPDVGRVAHGVPVGMDDYWTTEPNVPRVTGPYTRGERKQIPNEQRNRVDRLKCLGNAVVPQQFYPIFQAMAEIMDDTNGCGEPQEGEE